MCKIEIEISSIQLLTGFGCDEIIIKAVNFINGLYPFTGEQEVRMKVAVGTGEAWIKANFGIDILSITKIINT
jgi:hypothetical protein